MSLDAFPVAKKPYHRAATSKWGRMQIVRPDAIVEPTRDWSVLRIITGHRVRIATCMVLFTTALFWFQNTLWPHARYPAGLWENAWSWASLLWCTAIIPGSLGFLGMITYRYPEKLDQVQRIPQLVSWRIVSRGQNVEALCSTIRRCQTEMKQNPLFPYVIEVVIEAGSRLELLPQDNDVEYFLIPDDYVTENGTLFKARGLQYVLENSNLPDNAWIVHLDEETQPTSSGVKGICRMIHEEEESGQLRVGQGAILYHREWRKYPILTFADMVRTGDDFARFYFQHRLGRTVFGLHGSYVVVRNDVEKLAGFDFGPVGSITEDAFWALELMERGVRARWCEGYLEEQSTQSLMDFIKQRRRWYLGLVKVSCFAPVKLRWRICLGTNTLLWSLAPFAALYTIVHFLYGFHVRGEIQLIANLSYASFMTLYMTGLKANMDEHGITNPFQRIGMSLAQIALTPFFSILESVGVAYAMMKPDTGFHVVKK